MNLAGIADGDFPDCPQALPADDAIPPTLEPVLRFLLQDWVTQVLADARGYSVRRLYRVAAWSKTLRPDLNREAAVSELPATTARAD